MLRWLFFQLQTERSYETAIGSKSVGQITLLKNSFCDFSQILHEGNTQLEGKVQKSLENRVFQILPKI